MAHNSQLAFHVANMLQGINVTEANLFIQHHSETKECWFEALGLLDAHSMQVQFFAATIIHTKVSTCLFYCCAAPLTQHLLYGKQVKKNWSQLHDNEKEQIYNALCSLLRSLCSNYGEKKVLALPVSSVLPTVCH